MSPLTLADALVWLSEHQGAVRYERGIVAATARDELTILAADARPGSHGGSVTEATIAAVVDLQCQVAARRERRAPMAGGAR